LLALNDMLCIRTKNISCIIVPRGINAGLS